MKIGKKEYNRDHALIIAEVGQGYDGSLGMAHAFIDAIAISGANAVKFQTHIAAAESTPTEPWQIKFGYQDKCRYDYWQRMEFSPEQWRGLKQHAEDRGLIFLSSPYSLKAVELLMSLGINVWKIPSEEVGNMQLLEAVIQTRLPIILSSGMSTIAELDRAVAAIQPHGNQIAILQCTSESPCPPEHVGLNLISEIRNRYGCEVGLSDHSGTIYPGLAAVSLGIQILEIHVTLSREMFSPDMSASITTAELRQLVTGVRYIEKILSHPVDKNTMAEKLEPMRRLCTKSLVAARDLPVGTILQRHHLASKRPGLGIPPEQLDNVLGKRVITDLRADDLLDYEFLT